LTTHGRVWRESGVLEWVDTQRPVHALRWDGDDLMDWAEGPDRWSSDGTADLPRFRRSLGFAFDQTAIGASGRFQAAYAERGTKALLLSEGRLVRELNRSYYHADDFDYPIALGVLPDGRECVVHCPDAYNVLEIEDAETGARLTAARRAPNDFFHSVLSVSPDGRHLLDVGWVWHPYGMARIFDLQRALDDPSELDGEGMAVFDQAIDAEVSSACWLDDDRVAVATTNEEPRNDDQPDTLGPGQLGVWSIARAGWLHRCGVNQPVGTMIACGERIMALYGHPRLIDPTTGAVVAEWPQVAISTKQLCFGVSHIPTPIGVLHPDGTRLAVASGHRVAILTLPNHS
jgi:hypothetical protein